MNNYLKLAKWLKFTGGKLNLIDFNLEFRTGKSIEDIKKAIAKAHNVKNTGGRTENEIGMLELYLKDVLKPSKLKTDINENMKKKILKEWVGSLQDNYDGDYEQFESYDEMYNISTRLGFDSPQEAWDENPHILSTKNPNNIKVIKSLEEHDETDLSNSEEKKEVKIANEILKNLKLLAERLDDPEYDVVEEYLIKIRELSEDLLSMHGVNESKSSISLMEILKDLRK